MGGKNNFKKVVRSPVHKPLGLVGYQADNFSKEILKKLMRYRIEYLKRVKR